MANVQKDDGGTTSGSCRTAALYLVRLMARSAASASSVSRIRRVRHRAEGADLADGRRLDDVWTLRQNLRWQKSKVSYQSIYGSPRASVPMTARSIVFITYPNLKSPSGARTTGLNRASTPARCSTPRSSVWTTGTPSPIAGPLAEPPPRWIFTIRSTAHSIRPASRFPMFRSSALPSRASMFRTRFVRQVAGNSGPAQGLG